jgi:hypothetical protein
VRDSDRGRDAAFILNLIENAQRKELSQGERVRAISLLAAMHDTAGRSPLTYTQIRERTRLSTGTISSWVRIARRPALREALELDRLDIAPAMLLVRLDDARLASVLPTAAQMPRAKLEETGKSLRHEMTFPRSRKERSTELDIRRLMEAYRLLTLVGAVPATPEAADLWRMLVARVEHLSPATNSPGENVTGRRRRRR